VAKYDLLIWFEICEFGSNGEYHPAVGIFIFIIQSWFIFRLLITQMAFQHTGYFSCIKGFKDV